MSSERVFLYFFFGLLCVIVFYGAGMIAIIFMGETGVGLRMVAGFASMFSGLLGLGSGYLLGKTGSQ